MTLNLTFDIDNIEELFIFCLDAARVCQTELTPAVLEGSISSSKSLEIIIRLNILIYFGENRNFSYPFRDRLSTNISLLNCH